MSEIAINARVSGEGAFRPATVAIMLAIGILSFVAMLVLGAYAPDMRSGHNGGAHALSTSAVGYAGIVRLAEATGRHPRVIRNEHMLDGEDLVVLTPEHGTTSLTNALIARGIKPTLVVLPKWNTVADPGHGGWVRIAGLLPSFDPEGVLAPKNRLKVTRRKSGGQPLHTVEEDAPSAMQFKAPRPLQSIAGSDLHPIVTDQEGRVVVAQIGGGPFYVLADPDLLSNAGIADEHQAAAALALLDYLNSTGAHGIDFDVTLNGFGHSPSPLKLAFEPPFLAMTLAIAAAVLLAALQAAARFGTPRRLERAIPFGKAALIDNSAALVRKAGREAALGGRYADMIREQAAAAFGAPPRLRDDALDAYLDQLAGADRFSELADAANGATSRNEVLAAAQALHRWQWEKTSDG